MSSDVERYQAPVEGKVVTVCGEVEGSCRCALAPHADGPHECECGGSWEWQDGVFVMHSLPGSSTGGAPSWPSLLLFGGLFGSAVARAIAGPKVCHTTSGGIRVHVRPGCRCPRRKR